MASYSTDFTSRTRPIEFSAGAVSITKKGDLPYLGPFRETGVVFSLDKTPPHRLIHLVFDLALLNSWNGSSPYWGPDIWKAQVVDGQQLLSATFCNCGFFTNNNEQTYPDRYPNRPDFKPYPGWTGASEHETLGEIRSFGKSNPPSGDCSSVYHMDWTFPHSSDRLDLKFACHTKDKAMRFGFLNFHAEAIADLNQLNDDELKSNWAALIGPDAVAADTALWRLAATGNQAVDFVQSQSKAETWTSTKDLFVADRVLHLLEVVNTPEATKLLARLKSSPAAPQ